MPWDQLMPMMLVLPALFQAQRAESSPQFPIEKEAREFMTDYADDIRGGRRREIAARYDKRGAYRVGEGEKVFETIELIKATYLTQWTPPLTFEWHNLTYEAISPDAVVIIGQFEWGVPGGKVAMFSYTGLLVRQEGELRIRMEDESMDRRPALPTK